LYSENFCAKKVNLSTNQANMLEIINPIAKSMKIGTHNITGFIFKMHHTVTCKLLLLAAILVTLTQYFGEAIACMTKGNSIPAKILNNYCWVSIHITTFMFIQILPSI
jgi:hypothetical protein